MTLPALLTKSSGFGREETLPPPPQMIGKLLDDALVCMCRRVTKKTIKVAIAQGCRTVEEIREQTAAGGGCGSCQAAVGELIAQSISNRIGKGNKVEAMKQKQDGLDCLPDLQRFAQSGTWEEMSEDDKQRFKWYGVFFRKQTPGHFMLRVRITNGFSNARQFRLLADLADEYGKGFCDITTRQQIQLRWFTIDQVPDIWQRLEAVGLTTKQTGMDNIRNVCGCPVAGLTPHELFDASDVCREFTDLFLDNKDYTNLPRKFNATITGCLENCCHAETQDLALVPAYRELDGQQVNGFNVLVGGKQGSGGYLPATPLDVFVKPRDAADLCGHIVKIFRDHGPREQRTKARLAFLIQERGAGWFRAELEKRCGQPLHTAGTDLRKKTHTDHLGIYPQKRSPHDVGPPLHYAGLLVPVGRITTAQMRGLADLAERYGNGDIRLSVQQNVIIPNIPEDRLAGFTRRAAAEGAAVRPIAGDARPGDLHGDRLLPHGPDRHQGDRLEIGARAGNADGRQEDRPIDDSLSGCSAGCALHQTATIGLQGCRTRVNGQIVDAAHVCVNGKSGPGSHTASDLMYDVPCVQLADALEPLVKFLPR